MTQKMRDLIRKAQLDSYRYGEQLELPFPPRPKIKPKGDKHGRENQGEAQETCDRRGV